ncbi:MAG: hypothetical protein KDL87_07620 [Verrucomicrobiae bacterium]|nr:hypothetical protein [Verrucomicrobiae bacterium]
MKAPQNLFNIASTCGFLALATASEGGERTDSLRSILDGADRLVLSVIKFPPEAEKEKPFEFADQAKIAELLDRLDFVEEDSGFHCMCSGDSEVTFYKGGRELASLSHHHGRSLRWSDGKWDGDSLFTSEASNYWREWFQKNGEPRFENMHQEEVREQERERETHEKFLSCFPAAAQKVFSENLDERWVAFSSSSDLGKEPRKPSKYAQELLAFFPDRRKAALAIARSFGVLSEAGPSEGSWSMSSIREALVLDAARAINAEEFLFLVEQGDQLAHLGAARLFFFEDFADLLPSDQRGAIAARLCEAVLKGDHAYNSDIAVSSLTSYDCPETTKLLTRLAFGELAAATESSNRERDPQARVAAALILARQKPPTMPAIVDSLSRLPNLSEVDREALKISRALCGEKGLLPKELFELDSFVSYDALRALEEQGDKAALATIIEGAVSHDWAGVREEGIFAVERMTGRRWYQSQEEMTAEVRGMEDYQRSLHYAKQVTAWWEDNRDSFELPDKNAGNRTDEKPAKGDHL